MVLPGLPGPGGGEPHHHHGGKRLHRGGEKRHPSHPLREDGACGRPHGRGDSFVAAFCTGLTAGLPRARPWLFASHTAAITVSRMGAMPSLPTVEEVQQLLVERDYQGFDPAELDALKQ